VALQPFYDRMPKKNLLGIVVVGRLMDARAAADLGRITSSHVVFLQDGKVTVSTLPPLKEMEFARRFPNESTTEIFLNNERYHVSSVELSPGLQPTASLIVLKSYAESEAHLQRLNQLLLGLGLLAILAGGTLVFFISDTVTRPLASLVAGVHALERGDMSYSLEASGHDELSELTRAFDGRRRTLQRDEEQREQLEGQLRQAQNGGIRAHGRRRSSRLQQLAYSNSGT
jgi:HAMP domain-containing protein